MVFFSFLGRQTATAGGKLWRDLLACLTQLRLCHIPIYLIAESAKIGFTLDQIILRYLQLSARTNDGWWLFRSKVSEVWHILSRLGIVPRSSYGWSVPAAVLRFLGENSTMIKPTDNHSNKGCRQYLARGPHFHMNFWRRDP